jgi:hypothetical protein|tara:strand:- start:444 stop:548 length:105 start_codon:yes stop_codon:yes gene_type:complete
MVRLRMKQAITQLATGALMGALIAAALFGPMLLN